MQAGSRIGNYVEMKNTTLGEGSKANHLTYLGEAEIGAGVNVGCGTNTCKYAGKIFSALYRLLDPGRRLSVAQKNTAYHLAVTEHEVKSYIPHLVQFGQNLPLSYLITLSNKYLRYSSIRRRTNVHFHLHSFKNQNSIAF